MDKKHFENMFNCSRGLPIVLSGMRLFTEGVLGNVAKYGLGTLGAGALGMGALGLASPETFQNAASWAGDKLSSAHDMIGGWFGGNGEGTSAGGGGGEQPPMDPAKEASLNNSDKLDASRNASLQARYGSSLSPSMQGNPDVEAQSHSSNPTSMRRDPMEPATSVPKSEEIPSKSSFGLGQTDYTDQYSSKVMPKQTINIDPTTVVKNPDGTYGTGGYTVMDKSAAEHSAAAAARQQEEAGSSLNQTKSSHTSSPQTNPSQSPIPGMEKAKQAYLNQTAATTELRQPGIPATPVSPQQSVTPATANSQPLLGVGHPDHQPNASSTSQPPDGANQTKNPAATSSNMNSFASGAGKVAFSAAGRAGDNIFKSTTQSLNSGLGKAINGK